MGDNPLHSTFDPPPAYYDDSLNGWVLSRYTDVVAALHEQRLCPVDSRTENVPCQEEIDAQHRLRAQTFAACAGQQVKEWQIQFAEIAQQLMAKLRGCVRAEIVGNFAEPLGLDIALTVTRADRNNAAHLNALAHAISMASADPTNQPIREAAKAANDELTRYLESSPIPMSGPAFVALSQTLPSFLANAWLALLRSPQQFRRLREELALIPNAVEELLRYAGLAHTLFRRASSDINMAGVTITRGDRVMLKLSSANRDPGQFVNPECLDLGRRNGPQLALGIGLHSCAGGPLIRMLAGVAMTCFVGNVAELDPDFPIEWKGGTGFRTPKALYVLLQQPDLARFRQ
ncbi:MAG TPA: cytochrome P450 [Bryobacteraceae bacterium]|nr:cytochrome P450 [Bryobacteraceae bacterium]